MEVSYGSYLGVLKGDIANNRKIGKLMHDAWTYWGHSGAPLLTEGVRIYSYSICKSHLAEYNCCVHLTFSTSQSLYLSTDYITITSTITTIIGGHLLGLHSSWDDDTGIRHGIHY
jgi:hypothetical protein